MSEGRVSSGARRRVAARAGHRCEYCCSPEAFSAAPFCVEHIIPSSRGGTSELANLAFACAGCNAHKSNRLAIVDPLTNDEVPIFHPRSDKWTDHFQWSANCLELIGLTRIGRATIGALHLNRKHVRNLRRLLIREGEHPPGARPLV